MYIYMLYLYVYIYTNTFIYILIKVFFIKKKYILKSQENLNFSWKQLIILFE